VLKIKAACADSPAQTVFMIFTMLKTVSRTFAIKANVFEDLNLYNFPIYKMRNL